MLALTTIARNAFRSGVAIPAFNVSYLPMVEPVIRAVVDQDSFALIEVARLEWTKFGAEGPEAVAHEYARWEDANHVRLHLDHIPVIDEDGKYVEYLPIIERAIKLGYDSVMIDGSRLSLEDNIDATRKVAALAHQAGIPCEGELGAVLGHGEGPLPPYDELFASGQGFTKVDEARRFVAETGCDWLSVAIGNVHGAISAEYKDKRKIAARLDLDHLKALAEATSIPLVLHGGSGIPQELVLASFKKGITKINIATAIRQPYEATLRETGEESAAQDAVYTKTSWLIREYFGFDGLRSKITKEAL